MFKVLILTFIFLLTDSINGHEEKSHSCREAAVPQEKLGALNPQDYQVSNQQQQFHNSGQSSENPPEENNNEPKVATLLPLISPFLINHRALNQQAVPSPGDSPQNQDKDNPGVSKVTAAPNPTLHEDQTFSVVHPTPSNPEPSENSRRQLQNFPSDPKNQKESPPVDPYAGNLNPNQPTKFIVPVVVPKIIDERNLPSLEPFPTNRPKNSNEHENEAEADEYKKDLEDGDKEQLESAVKSGLENDENKEPTNKNNENKADEGNEDCRNKVAEKNKNQLRFRTGQPKQAVYNDPAKGPGISQYDSQSFHLSQRSRVCYACSTLNDPSCFAPNATTTIKYCRKGRDYCVKRIYSNNVDSTVVVRDCASECKQESKTQFKNKTYQLTCTICGEDMCNGATSIYTQGIVIALSLASAMKYLF